jgi:predicted nucleic acid-binding Zn ribbon protein
MRRARAVYQCVGCGNRRKTLVPIYKFDEDGFHATAFEQSPEMIAAQEEAQSTACEKCHAEAVFKFIGWDESQGLS